MEDFVEDVLALVERIPPGRVMSYGAIARCLGAGGPRQVGAVMAHYGGMVPWHRVVAANGRVVPGHEEQALRRLRAEGTPLRADKVDMARAAWFPDPASPDPTGPDPVAGPVLGAPIPDPPVPHAPPSPGRSSAGSR